MLELAHIPYHYDPQRSGYRINRHFFLPPVNLTVTEALAVLMLAGRLRGAGRLPLLAQSAQAAAKLESALPQAIRQHVGSVMDNLSVVFSPVSRHEGLDTAFQDLAGAIAQRRVCRLVYISFHERKQIMVTVHPLRLLFQSRAWYLIAYSPREKQARTYKLGRIRKLTVTARKFTPPRGLDPDEYFGEAWSMIPEGRLYDVHLHFEPKVAGNVAEVYWHRRQAVQWNDDGSIEFRVTVDGLGEITWWILGYGDEVEVVGPPELRDRVAAVAASMARKYHREVG
jgi:proteasome accessory factor B